MYSAHHEPHFSNRNNWLRATVLGANDGLISTACIDMNAKAKLKTKLMNKYFVLHCLHLCTYTQSTQNNHDISGKRISISCNSVWQNV